jgi:hypothetical protein
LIEIDTPALQDKNIIFSITLSILSNSFLRAFKKRLEKKNKKIKNKKEHATQWSCLIDMQNDFQLKREDESPLHGIGSTFHGGVDLSLCERGSTISQI